MRGSAAFRTGVAPGGALAGPWVKNSLWTAARVVPSLDLRFAENKSLVDATTGSNLVTFTRASSGTFVGSDGLIKTASTDVPRFDHNPTTGESLGLLVEEARTNLSLYSEDFSNAYWVKQDCTITANESTAPDGTLTADLWSNTGTPGIVASSNITKDATARTYTGSLWVKGGSTAFTFSLDNGATVNRGRAIFNLTSGTLTSVSNDGNFTNTSGTITAYPDGWYRLTITTTTSTITTIRLRSFFSGSNLTVRIWGAQVEEGAFATSYIPTTTATVTRSADVASISGSNFSSWYRQDEGTVFSENVWNTNSDFGTVWGIDDGTSNNEYRLIGWNNATDRSPTIVASGINQATLSNSYLPGIIYKYGIAFKQDDVASSRNGSAILSDGTVALPLVTSFRIGSTRSSAFELNGTIKRLCYWNQRLPNSTLQGITQ